MIKSICRRLLYRPSSVNESLHESIKPSQPVIRFSPILVVTGLLLLTGAIAGAQQDQRIPELPAASHEYANVSLPAHFNNNNIANADNTPANNPVTNEGATLGRVLFYDPLLSANNSTSCSSCHLQEHGFSDPAALSQGFDGGLTGRNSMGLTNARYYENGHFFWDERADTLEEQVLLPIQDSVEMGLTLAELETKLAGADYYPELFEDAFGSPEISSDRVALALSQFVRSMVSYQAKYDAGVAQNFANFTPQENQGRRIFEGPAGGCAACHGTAIQITDQPFNNGLDATTTDEGAGNGRFKVPSLRNVELTAPYMHDGRFATLAAVVEHYNSGVQPHPNLANQLRARGGPGGGGPGGGGPPRRLNLTQAQKDSLVAFMNTLTDDTFITDERFADPFVDAPPATVQPTATSEPSPVPPTPVRPTQVPPTVAPPTTVPPTDVPPTVVPTTQETSTAIPTTSPPNATATPVETQEPQEEVDIRPGRRREVRFGNTRNGPRLRLNLPGNSVNRAVTLGFSLLDDLPDVLGAQVVPNTDSTTLRFAGSHFTLNLLEETTAANVLTFAAPVDFEVRYLPSAGLDANAIRLFVWDPESATWSTAACGTESVNMMDDLVNAQVCQVGEFALFEVTTTTTDTVAEPTAPTAELPPSAVPVAEPSNWIFLPMVSNQ